MRNRNKLFLALGFEGVQGSPLARPYVSKVLSAILRIAKFTKTRYLGSNKFGLGVSSWSDFINMLMKIY